MFHFTSPYCQGYDGGFALNGRDQPAWDHLPCGRMSLWDMINCTLDGVLTALMLLRNHMGIAIAAVAQGKGGDPLPEKYKENILNNLQFAQRMCGQFLLSSAEDRVVIIWNMWNRQFSYSELAIELKPLLEAFESDLKKEYFYHYPRHKALALLMIPPLLKFEWVG